MTPCLMSTARARAVAALFWCAGHPAGAVGLAIGGLMMVGGISAEGVISEITQLPIRSID